MRPFASALILSAALLAAPGFAQPSTPVTGPQDSEKVKQVFVYGEDPCPAGEADEIVICARLPDNDRYRIPKELRTDPYAPANEAWANRARSLETVGASGINSCSPSGGGGATGCFNQLFQQARAERKSTLGDASWADAVAAERARRLGNIDEESEAVEQDVLDDEADADARARAQAAARKRLMTQEQATEEKATAGPTDTEPK